MEGISDLETDASTTTATFKATKDVDVGELLDELSKTNRHISGWSQNAAADTGAAKDSSDASDT